MYLGVEKKTEVQSPDVTKQIQLMEDLREESFEEERWVVN